MINYFSAQFTVEEIKSTYRNLCKQHHPDRGGNVEVMQEVNRQYQERIKTAHQHTGKTQDQVDEEMEIEAIFMEKVQAISALQGLIIELCGRWIWVTGETRTAKDTLKACGFFWASKKLAWFWRPEDARTWNRKEKSLEEIRAKYGTREIKTSSTRCLA